MKILVCLKQILDPEMPPRDFKVDAERRVAVQGAANLVTNIFCENALETALQLKETSGGEITALAFGPPSSQDVLRKALAMKADVACWVEDPEPDMPNSAVTAKVLAAAVNKLGDFDLVLTGREAGDWGAGQTGSLLAEELEFPFVGFVDEIKVNDQQATVRRQTESGVETIECSLPLAITITNSDDNLPRIPKTRDIMMSGRKPITSFSLEDLDIGQDEVKSMQSGVEIVELTVPKKEIDCEFAEGETLDEKIDAFAKKIVSAIQSS